MTPRPILIATLLSCGLTAFSVFAKAPADATGECKDGSYTKADQKEGACSSHGGVKDWFMKAKAEATAKPANATGECKDGTYTDADSKSGACSGHKGVKEWYGPAAKPTTTKAPPTMAPAPENKEAAPTRPTQSTSTSSDRAAKTQPTQTWERPKVAAAGGGAGKVWVNSSSKVYHCEKDEWYGKTKRGEYMTQSEAKAAGARAARGKECS